MRESVKSKIDGESFLESIYFFLKVNQKEQLIIKIIMLKIT